MSAFAIDQKERIILNGLPHTIHIRSKKQSNPILLCLHGGPGVPNRHALITRHTALCEHFTLVAYDQRGTGGSYFGAREEDMTLATFVRDAYALIMCVCRKFGQEKVFVLGGSWGTELGIRLIQAHPEVVSAFVGYGQAVDGYLNEELSYRFTLERAAAANNEKDMEILRRIGPPVVGCYKPVYEGLLTQRKLLIKYGGHSAQKSSLWSGTIKPMLLSGEYSLHDLFGIVRGSKFSLQTMWQEIVRYSFIEDAALLSVPVYFFAGRLDQNTPSELVQQYYDAISAPRKELIWFEHSGHRPLDEEPERFHALLIEKLISV